MAEIFLVFTALRPNFLADTPISPLIEVHLAQPKTKTTRNGPFIFGLFVSAALMWHHVIPIVERAPRTTVAVGKEWGNPSRIPPPQHQHQILEFAQSRSTHTTSASSASADSAHHHLDFEGILPCMEAELLEYYYYMI